LIDHSSMDPTPRTHLRVRRALVAFTLVLVFGAGVGVDRIAWRGGPNAGASSSFTDSPEFTILQQTWDTVHAEYVDEAAIDDRELVYGAAAGLVEALGDTGHSRFLDPVEAREFEESLRGEFTGIGVELDVPVDRPIVVAPIDGSPADEAGILPGDVILEVDGQSTRDLAIEDLADLIRGDEGTPVTLVLQHAEEDTTYEVTLTRRLIVLQPVTWRMLPGGVAHVRLSEFSEGAADALRQAITAALEAGGTAIVLDVRGNPGGLVSEAVAVASQFLPEGTTIFQQEERNGAPSPVTTEGSDGLALDLPLVVLANEYSASAAEIIAGALRDNGRAALIGATTYGTGTVLIPFELEDRSVLLLGTALWLTADGDQIWKEGVEPDVAIETPLQRISRPRTGQDLTAADLAALEDDQLLAAHERLTGDQQTRTSDT